MKSYKFHLKLSISLKNVFRPRFLNLSTIDVLGPNNSVGGRAHPVHCGKFSSIPECQEYFCLLCVTNGKISRHCHESLEGTPDPLLRIIAITHEQ